MNWKETTIHLGIIREKSRVTVKYEYTGDKEIKDITRGCPKCTKILGMKDSTLEVVFIPGYIPIHLRRSPGYQDARKILWVTYDDNSKEKLVFTAKVVR